MSWKHQIATDGECQLFGVNIFSYEWKQTKDTINYEEPYYHRLHTLPIYTVEISGKSCEFAAREVSNCVWIFVTEQ